MRRTLTQGLWVGLASGLGAGTADGLYATIAAFGLTAVIQSLLNHDFWLRLGGGLGLIYLGIATLVAKPSQMPILHPTTASLAPSSHWHCPAQL